MISKFGVSTIKGIRVPLPVPQSQDRRVSAQMPSDLGMEERVAIPLAALRLREILEIRVWFAFRGS